ncbi:MAG: hypothetical protein QG628_445 [Patescibacteria group bacterium]|nr:hypothetical protein [Patescibacteria group bacterium]
MAKTTSKVKKSSKTKKSSRYSDNGSIYSAAAILFAGACIVLLGAIQDFDNLTLLMVGFGSALLVVGGSLLGVATKASKR